MPSGPHSGDQSGQQFERLVADLYRSLGYRVQPNVYVGGQQIDVLAQREVEGAPPIKLGVECKDLAKAVSNQTVQDFVTSVESLRVKGMLTAGAMVSRNGFTPRAKEVAQGNPHMTLLSWQELSAKLFNVTPQLEELVADYEDSDVFRAYVPVDVEPLKWAGLSA
jgi:hypothetical protein